MSDQQYSDLFEFLTVQFSKIDQRFDAIENRLTALEGRVLVLEDLGHFLVREIKELREEGTVGAYRSRRVEDWVLKASKKIGLPYEA